MLDIHTGFPFSNVDNDLNFVGPRNAAGRFPMLLALDLQIRRPFQIPILKKKHKVIAGVKIFNITNHFNPRDVQQNIFSPSLGGFFNSVPREFRAKFEFEF